MSTQLDNLIQLIKNATLPSENTALRVGTTLELLDTEKADLIAGKVPEDQLPMNATYISTISGNTAISSFYRKESPVTYTSVVGEGAIELVSYNRSLPPGTGDYGATGIKSIALGFATKSTQESAIAIGSGSEASGLRSIAIGRSFANGNYPARAISDDSIVIGSGIAEGGSTILSLGGPNQGGQIYGARGLIVGGNVATISANTSSCSILGGAWNQIENITGSSQLMQGAIMVGGTANNIHDASYAITLGGINNTATCYFETVIGPSALLTGTQSANSWIGTDRLFTIGNGTVETPITRSNAFSVLKNGTITAPSFTPALIKTGDAKSLITKEVIELTNTSTIYTTSTELNIAYPNALKGSEVYKSGDTFLMKKVTETVWAKIILELI